MAETDGLAVSAGLKGVTDVIGYIDKSIDNFDAEDMFALKWRNSEVLELLTDIRAGLIAGDVTWAEVSIDELLAEVKELREVVRGGMHTSAKYYRKYGQALGERDRVAGERDRARDLAARLEAELAIAEHSVKVTAVAS